MMATEQEVYMGGRMKGKAGRQEVIGFTDKGGSGGYENETLKEAEARSCAKSDMWVNESAGNTKTKSQQNHVGGSRAGT